MNDPGQNFVKGEIPSTPEELDTVWKVRAHLGRAAPWQQRGSVRAKAHFGVCWRVIPRREEEPRRRVR